MRSIRSIIFKILSCSSVILISCLNAMDNLSSAVPKSLKIYIKPEHKAKSLQENCLKVLLKPLETYDPGRMGNSTISKEELIAAMQNEESYNATTPLKRAALIKKFLSRENTTNLDLINVLRLAAGPEIIEEITQTLSHKIFQPYSVISPTFEELKAFDEQETSQKPRELPNVTPDLSFQFNDQGVVVRNRTANISNNLILKSNEIKLDPKIGICSNLEYLTFNFGTSAYIFSHSTGKTLEVKGHLQPIKNFFFNPCSSHALSYSDEALFLWNLETQDSYKLPVTPKMIKFDLSGKYIFYLDDGKVYRLEIATKELWQLPEHEKPISQFCFSPTGAYIVTNSDNPKELVVTNVATKNYKNVSQKHKDIKQLIFNPDDVYLTTLGYDGSMKCWNLEKNKRFTIKGHEHLVTKSEFSSTNSLRASTHFVSISPDRLIVWDTKRRDKAIEVSNDDIVSASFSNRARYYTLFDTKTNEIVIDLETGDIHTITFPEKMISIFRCNTDEYVVTRAGTSSYLSNLAKHQTIALPVIEPNAEITCDDKYLTVKDKTLKIVWELNPSYTLEQIALIMALKDAQKRSIEVDQLACQNQSLYDAFPVEVKERLPLKKRG